MPLTARLLADIHIINPWHPEVLAPTGGLAPFGVLKVRALKMQPLDVAPSTP